MPEIERSSGEAFRKFPNHAWIADDTVTSPDRHEVLIELGASRVAQDSGGALSGFLTAELHQDTLHIWQMSVRSEEQRKGIGRDLIKTAVHLGRATGWSAYGAALRDDAAALGPTFFECSLSAPPNFVAVPCYR